MKFVSFSAQGTVRAGVLLGEADGPNDRIVDLVHPSMKEALRGVTPQLQPLIEAGLPAAVANIEAHGFSADAMLPLHSVTLMAPLPQPRRIFGIAHNYRDALAERGMALPKEPVVFMKAPRTIAATGQRVILPAGIGGVTWEAELAAVIGSRADNVSKAGALDHVAGYACFNDISASEIIKADGHFDRGKNFATFGAFGPFLVSADEIPDPHALTVSLKVDGRTMQAGSTHDMLFGVADLICYLSARQPLQPGDIIATGTPAGVAGMHRPPAWLKPGSVVEVEVGKLGRLINPVTEGPAPDA